MTTLYNKIFTDGVILAFITFAAFSCCYYYEFGACLAYGIPSEFISIELSNNVIVGFVALGILYPFMSTGLRWWLYLAITKLKFVRRFVIIGGLILTLATIIVAKGILWQHGATCFLIIAYVFGLLLFSFAQLLDDEELTTEITAIDRRKILTFSLFLFSGFIVVICILGYYFSLAKSQYAVKNNSHFVLLKRYGSTVIYGKIQNDTMTYGEVMIDLNPSQTDTLEIAEFEKLKIVNDIKKRPRIDTGLPPKP